MPYTFNKKEEDEYDEHVYTHGDGQPVTTDELTEVPQYDVIDPDGDWIATVHSQTEAEGLVSHLNRGQ